MTSQYADNCDSEVTLGVLLCRSGYLPTEDIANFCMPATVEAIDNGETCDDRDPEAVRLFNFPGAESFTIVNGGSSIIEIAPDSTMHIVLEVEDATETDSSLTPPTKGTRLERVACEPQACTTTRRTVPTSSQASKSGPSGSTT